MTQLSPEEVTAGLCVFLDVAVLVDCAGCRSNARSRANLANRSGPFLLVGPAPGAAADSWLCVPLLSNAGSNRLVLDRALKSGPGGGWIGRDSYFSRHQFWIIPTGCVVEASGGEFSPTGQRQRYARNAPAALAAIAAHMNDSDSPYRHVKELA